MTSWGATTIALRTGDHQVILIGDGSGHPGERPQARVADDDMLHAYRNPIRVFEFEDLTMLIGPDAAGRLLEVGTATAEGIEFIVHAMPARPKFLR